MKKTLLFYASMLLVGVNVLHAQSYTITTIAGNGTAGSTGNGGQATAAELHNPHGVAVDAAGNVYVVEYNGNRVRKVAPSGIISAFAGTGVVGFSGDGGQATAAELNYPTGVAVDAAGNVYIADHSNNRVRIVNTSNIISTFAGNGTAAYSGDGGQATAAELYAPYGMAIDAAGNVYIADNFNERIRKVKPSGIISTFAGNGIGGYSGDGGPAIAAELSHPYAVAIDNANRILYIADESSEHVRKINSSGIITTLAGNGNFGYYGDGGPATVAEFEYVTDVATDAAGNVYIADQSNNRIRIVNSLGIITTIAGNGTAGFYGDGGPATAAELHTSTNVTVDASGNIYIADFNNNRVRELISTPLPIQLLYFQCNAASDGIALNWATATEQNNHYFTLERSSDGIHFTPIATVNGAGNSTSTRYYTYTDNEPLYGANYYRLQQTDYDGTSAYFNITECDAIVSSPIIYPNPSNGIFSVLLPADASKQPAYITLTDMVGKQVYASVVQGQQQVTVNIAHVASAVYIITITTSNKTYRRKIIITH